MDNYALTCINIMYPRIQIPPGARESTLAWGQRVGRHQREHNIPNGDVSSLPGWEAVEVVEMAVHLSIHRKAKRMYG